MLSFLDDMQSVSTLSPPARNTPHTRQQEVTLRLAASWAMGYSVVLLLRRQRVR
jgi:hypothetical protein